MIPHYGFGSATVHPILQAAVDHDFGELQEMTIGGPKISVEGESSFQEEPRGGADRKKIIHWVERDTAPYTIDGFKWDCPRLTLCLAAPSEPSYVHGIPLEMELVYLPLLESTSSCGASPVIGPSGPVEPTSPQIGPNTQLLLPPTAVVGNCASQGRDGSVASDAVALPPFPISGRVIPVIRARVTSCCFHSFIEQDSGLVLQDEIQHLADQLHDDNKEEGTSMRNASGGAPFGLETASSVVMAVLAALSVPREAALRSQRRPARDEVLSMWRFHANGNCANCHVAELLPASWETFAAASRADQDKLMTTLYTRWYSLQVIQSKEEAAFLAKRQSAARHALLSYVPKSPALFQSTIPPSSLLWQWASWKLPDGRSVGLIHPALLHFLGNHDVLRSRQDARAFRTAFCRQDTDHVFSFPFLTDECCKLLSEEVKHYEAIPDMPQFRPNSTNRYGLILNEVGLRPFVNALCKQFVFPLAQALFPEALENEVGQTGMDEEEEAAEQRTSSAVLDSHHTFVVEYRQDADILLDMHSDDSEITLNVNLLDQFEGSSLCFCGMAGSQRHRKHSRSYFHEKGRAVMHPGSLRHGALPITSGERMNLIVWCRSTWLRQHNPERGKRYGFAAEEEQPDKVCLSATHDPDFQKWSLA